MQKFKSKWFLCLNKKFKMKAPKKFKKTQFLKLTHH